MASGSVDAAVVQRTRDTLGKVIKKPPLTDKLLNRPPFRYLHNIITEVDKASGFFDGLYTAQELDAKNIQDKEAKIQFLQKAVDTVSLTTGELVKVKPSKIVSGQEVERTNEFLQLMSIAILKKLDSSEAVKKVLSGEKPADILGKDKKKRPSDKKEGKTASSSDPSTKRSHSKERGQRSAGSGGAARTKPKERAPDSPAPPGKDKAASEEASERPKHRPSKRRPPPEADTGSGEEAMGGATKEATPLDSHPPGGDSEGGEDEGLGGSETRIERPSSARGQRRRGRGRERGGGGGGGEQPHGSSGESNEEIGAGVLTEPTTTAEGDDLITESHDAHMTATRSPSPSAPLGMVAPVQRPSSSAARPAPPKVVKHSSNEDISRIMSGSNIGPPLPVILDHQQGEEGDDQFEVEESAPLDVPPPSQPFTAKETINEKPEGALTKTLAATKERLEGGQPRAGGEDSEHSSLSEAQRRKEKEMVAKEIDKLQGSIQTLCKSANPLGKIMDYVQEDMDSMYKELEMWKAENAKHAETLREEERITEAELSPLKAQLQELEDRIAEQVDLISTTKANVLKNDSKMHQMLKSFAFASS